MTARKPQAGRRVKTKVSRATPSHERVNEPRARRSEAKHNYPLALQDIADVIGSVDGLPADLSANTKRYLTAWGYGRNRRPPRLIG